MKDIDFMDDAISNLVIEKPKTSVFTRVQIEDDAKAKEMHQKSYLKKKYRLALKLSAQLDMQELSNIHPEWGAKDILVEIMKDYYSDFPSEIVLEMSHYIVTEWEKIKASKKELILA